MKLSNKSLRPDGFIIELFQTILFHSGSGCLASSGGIETNRSILKALNATFLMLVSKKDKVEGLNGYNPIGLYNVIYKVIIIIMENMLKPLLPKLIAS